MSGINNEAVRPRIRMPELPDDVVRQFHQILSPLPDEIPVGLVQKLFDVTVSLRDQLVQTSIQPPKEWQKFISSLPADMLDTVYDLFDQSIRLFGTKTIGDMRSIASQANVQTIFGREVGSFIRDVFGSKQR